MSDTSKSELIADWNMLRESALCTDLPEHEILKSLSTLNKLFISRDRAIEGYASSDEAVSAYTLFYLPTNIPKFFFILEQLPSWIKDDFKKCHFMDIGTGPGTYLLAFLSVFGENFKGDIIGIDRSDRMLAQARRLLERFFPDLKNFHLLNRLPDRLKPGRKILFFGHSLNEIGIEKTLDIIAKVSPDHLFVIEPGTRPVFTKILKLRTEMLRKGYRIIYPCPEGVEMCPMDNNGGNWCHQVLRTTHHAGTERLSQLFSKDRRTMPLISHVYSMVDHPCSADGFARVLRRVKETKFSYIREICTKESPGRVVRIEILKRGLSGELKKGIRNSDTGTRIRFDVIKKIEACYWRVALRNY